MPEMRPPPPTGTTKTSGGRPSWADRLQGHGPLAGHRHGVVEGGDDGGPRLRGVGGGGGVGVVEGVAGEPQLDEVPGQRPDPGHLLPGRPPGEEDDPGDGQVTAAPGHPLGVVAGAGAHHPGAQALGGEGGDEVVGAADLVGPDGLEVLALQIDRGAVARRQPVAQLQGRLHPHGPQAFGGGLDIGQTDEVAPNYRMGPSGTRRGAGVLTSATGPPYPRAYGGLGAPRPGPRSRPPGTSRPWRPPGRACRQVTTRRSTPRASSSARVSGVVPVDTPVRVSSMDGRVAPGARWPRAPGPEGGVPAPRPGSRAGANRRRVAPARRIEAALWPPMWMGMPPDRMGLRMGVGVGEAEELPLEGRPLGLGVGPQGAHHVDALVGAPAAGGEVDPAGLELLAHPAHADAESDAALGQRVESGQPLGHDHRVMGGQDEDTGGEHQPGGGRGQESEDVDRIGDGAVVGQWHPPRRGVGIAARVVADHHRMLDQDDRLEAAVLGVPGEARSSSRGRRRPRRAPGGERRISWSWSGSSIDRRAGARGTGDASPS